MRSPRDSQIRPVARRHGRQWWADRRRCGTSFPWRRTYDVRAAIESGWVLAGVVGVNLDRGLGRVATQTLTFMPTPRGLDVLKLVVQGLSNPDIAERRVAGSISHRYPGEIGARAQPLLPRRKPWPGPCAPGWCKPGSTGHLRRPGETGRYGRSDDAARRVSLVDLAARGWIRPPRSALRVGEELGRSTGRPAGDGGPCLPASPCSDATRSRLEAAGHRVLACISETPRPARRIRPGGRRCP